MIHYDVRVRNPPATRELVKVTIYEGEEVRYPRHPITGDEDPVFDMGFDNYYQGMEQWRHSRGGWELMDDWPILFWFSNGEFAVVQDDCLGDALDTCDAVLMGQL